MKFNEIKINSYGNLKDKNINLGKLNIVYGKNESGKSTLLNFIESIFYGVSRNKNGDVISDYDRYLPWNENDFSGYISYTLDNEKMYDVFRDFSKKNVEIYDQNKNDISKIYTIDKKLGNQFFIEQTGLDRETLESTVITSQNKVKLNSTIQNGLIQKIANISETGNEELSIKKALDNLNKKLLKEVGTDKSTDRPINISRMNVKELSKKIERNKEQKANVISLNNELAELTKKQNDINIRKDILENIKNIKEKLKSKKDIIEFKKDSINNNKNKINEIENIKNDNNKKIKNKNRILFLTSIIIFIFASIIICTLNKNIKTKIFVNLLLFIILMILNIFNVKKKKSNNNENQIKLLNEQIEKLENEINEDNSYINKIYNEEKENIEKKYKIDANELFNSNIDLELTTINKRDKELSNNIAMIKVKLQYIERELEELSQDEENFQIESNKVEILEHKAREFEITKDLLQESYEELKKNITPQFNNDLGKNIEIFTNGKYKDIVMNDDIYIILPNKKIVSVEKLSIGTIQQIYLALRISMINKLSKEKMPIILDETFAYYDDDRMEASLENLAKIENQVIILTCSNREKRIYDKMKIDYNLVDL